MIKKPSIKKWKKYFHSRGVSDEVISEYLPYIKKIQGNNAPVIFEFEHLSRLIGIKRCELAKIVNSPENYHRKFSIPKRKGGRREIVSPYPSLLHCQTWIYKNILLPQPVHDCAHGFVPGRSIITNAEKHLSKKTLLKLDLKNFFPSIPINWVVNYFSSLGYANNVAFYLAALCCYEGKLSQGSSTSPYLTNILLLSLDRRLIGLANRYDLAYTRYADDLTFSGNYIPHKYIDIVSGFIDDYGLSINPEKTRLHTKQGQRIVTGISVSGNELKLPRSTKRELRKEIHYIQAFGFLSHVTKKKIKHPCYLESLIGKFGFWLHVEPNNNFAKKALEHLSEIRHSVTT